MVLFTRREYRVIRAVEPFLVCQRKGQYDDLNARQMRETYHELVLTTVLYAQVLLLCFSFACLFATLYHHVAMAVLFACAGLVLLAWLPQNVYNILVCHAHYRHKWQRDEPAQHFD